MTESDGGGTSREQQFQELWQYARRLIAFFVRRYNTDREEARDLTQDVYMKVHRSMDSYRGEAKWAFLERVAHNVALNRRRAEATDKRAGIEVQVDEVHEGYFRHDDDDYAERAEKERRLRQLREAIAKLPDTLRQCLLLRLADFSYTDIQNTLKISLDAVKTRLKEAKIRLRKMLGAESGASELLDTLPEDES